MAGPPRYAQRKDSNQSPIVSALRDCGVDVWVLHEPCDLLCGYRGLTMCLEVKGVDGKKQAKPRKLTPTQKIFHSDWRGHKAIVTDPESAIAAVLAHCRGRAP